MEVIQELKRCHDALKTATGRIDKLKDSVIALQRCKLDNHEQQIKIQEETVGQFQSKLETEFKSYRDVVA